MTGYHGHQDHYRYDDDEEEGEEGDKKALDHHREASTMKLGTKNLTNIVSCKLPLRN